MPGVLLAAVAAFRKSRDLGKQDRKPARGAGPPGGSLARPAGARPMARRYYDRRDLIGHWIRKQQRQQQPCTHARCRGHRVHPDNYPVILPGPARFPESRSVCLTRTAVAVFRTVN